jgi:ATP-dependent Lhr-like helicase
VVMYGPPPGWESFVQRVGRGNRRGNKSNVLCLATPDGETPFGQMLSFEALLWQISQGRLEQRPAMELYGAAVQQLLTLLAERSGGYERLGSLVEVFAPWPHLNSDVIRLIADSLAESEFVLPHTFLNRIGAGHRLHQLHDLGLIWGNFPASSGAVPLLVSGREIGTIPRVNLARLQAGAVIRFAGQRLRVNRIRRDGIYLETAVGSGNEVDISYGGLRPPIDPAIIEAMLHLLEADVPDPHMRTADSVTFTAKAERIKQHISGDVIPVAKDTNQFLYFTFGGQLLNGAIARYSRSTEYRAGEIVLESTEPINFNTLPDDIDSLLPETLPLLANPMRLTVFQQLLPPELLDRELAQYWSNPGVYARSLNRLRRSVQRSVRLPDMQDVHF